MGINNNDLIHEINVAAYYIAEGKNPYDTLCHEWARISLTHQNLGMTPPEDQIKERTAQMLFSGTPYDVLTYLIAELEIKTKYGMYETE